MAGDTNDVLAGMVFQYELNSHICECFLNFSRLTQDTVIVTKMYSQAA